MIDKMYMNDMWDNEYKSEMIDKMCMNYMCDKMDMIWNIWLIGIIECDMTYLYDGMDRWMNLLGFTWLKR